MTLRFCISEAIVCVSVERGCAIREQFDRKFFALFHEIDYIHADVVLSKGNGILRHEMRRLLFSSF